jgi:hypothetical protein
MAKAAQVQANRKNATRSTGPRTDVGEERARLNALKRGERAKTVASVLPQEDPAALEARIRQWVEDLRPGDAAEHDLVTRAARTSWELDRLERHETAKLSVRVRKAQVKVDLETANQVADLGRKLLYMAGKRVLPTSGPAWDDNPRAFLVGLESTAEGCRWLRDRWAELGRMLRRGDMWTFTDLYRSIRLQGKHPVHAINDPGLNAQFLAWEVLEPTGGTDFWARCYQLTPRYDPGFSGFMEWREIVDRPGSEEEALDLLAGVIDEHIARLEELIAVHEEVAGAEAFERADAASFDAGPEGEALRRRRTALGREMRQMIELVLKMQAARDRRASREGEVPAERVGGSPRAKGRSLEDRAGQVRPAGSRRRGAVHRANEAKPGTRPDETRCEPRSRSERTIVAGGIPLSDEANHEGSDQQDAANEATLQSIRKLLGKRFAEMIPAYAERERTQAGGSAATSLPAPDDPSAAADRGGG